MILFPPIKSKFELLYKILSVNKYKDDFFWQRNLIFVAIAQFVTMLGMSSVVPFMPLFVVQLGIKNPETAKLWSGLIFAGPFILSFIAAPFWGALGDKKGRKFNMIRAVFGLGLAVFFMAFVQNVVQLFILRIIQGGISGMIAASLAFISANTPEHRAGYAIGILQGAQSAGTIVGPFVGGLISDLLGIRPAFYGVALLCFISGILVAIYVKENKETLNSFNRTNIWENLSFAFKNKFILMMLIFLILSQAGINITNPVFIFFVKELHAPPKFISSITGSLIAIVGIFSILFSPYWGNRNDNKNYRKTLMVSTAIIGISSILHIFMPNYLLLYPLRILIGIFFAAVTPTIYSELNRKCPAEIKGSVMGIASSATQFGALISFLTCGVLTSNFGIDSAFILGGILLLIVSFLSYFIKQPAVILKY